MAATVVCVGAHAVTPPFTFDASAYGGGSFTADNLLIYDESTVLLGPGTFTESGTLTVTNAQLGASTFIPTGLTSTPTGGADYSLYFTYSGGGTISGALPTTSGTFTSLTYDFWANDGTNPAVKLASGSLLDGTVGTVAQAPGFAPNALARLTFTPLVPSFFTDPSPFYNVVFTSFIHNAQQVDLIPGGFTIKGGGGSVNFASAVPEPETYTMILAGLGALGFLARRRRGGGGSDS